MRTVGVNVRENTPNNDSTELQGGAKCFQVQFRNLPTLIKKSNLYGIRKPAICKGETIVCHSTKKLSMYQEKYMEPMCNVL